MPVNLVPVQSTPTTAQAAPPLTSFAKNNVKATVQASIARQNVVVPAPVSVKPNLTFWGDSHLTEYHKMPAEILKDIKDRFNIIQNRSRGGWLFTKWVVQQIIDQIKADNDRGQHQIHVVMLGSNNFRKTANDEEKISAEIERLVFYIKQILLQCYRSTGCGVIFAGMIPDPDPITDAKLSAMDTVVSQMKFGDMGRFINFRPVLSDANGLNLANYEPGDIHLSPQGAAAAGQMIRAILEDSVAIPDQAPVLPSSFATTTQTIPIPATSAPFFPIVLGSTLAPIPIQDQRSTPVSTPNPAETSTPTADATPVQFAAPVVISNNMNWRNNTTTDDNEVTVVNVVVNGVSQVHITDPAIMAAGQATSNIACTSNPVAGTSFGLTPSVLNFFAKMIKQEPAD
jgi:hypothetical protein